MKEYKPFKSGKVREVYDAGDSIIMVATDRISAFDHILKNKITKKGKVLTQMSKFWFDFTKDIIPNHMISVDNNDMPEFFQQPQFIGNSMKCKKLTMLPMECIVRGYITGSGWASYQENGTICGIKLPAGLKESEKLPEPIFTPSTMRMSPSSRALLSSRRSSLAMAWSMPRNCATIRLPSTRSALRMLFRAASSSPTRSSSSASMRMATSSSATRS